MCTVVVLHRPGHRWPMLLAANRDELADRPWKAPARHWRDRPAVIGGLDVLGGGTWLGLNDGGVVAAVLNRINTLGPAPGRLSRGGLPLAALEHPSAEQAATALARIDPLAYRPFNLVVADAVGAFCVRVTDGSQTDDGEATVDVQAVPPGLSMVTAYDPNDLRSPRMHRYLPQFAASAAPLPERGDWRDWVRLLASRESDPGAGPGGAMTVVTSTGFGTVSSSLLALPARREGRPTWLFAPGRPGEQPFQSVPG